jgi:FKBP-type peptidyl-prolyl cis-trans isomerase FkpA
MQCVEAKGPNIGPLFFPGVFFMRVLLALLASLALTPIAMAQTAQPVTTASGLVFESLKEGTGDSPKATDTVKVHYKGMFLDGKEFDSSYKRGEPTEFPLNRVIPCWTEGVQRMKPGGKAKLTCPPAIAYGAAGAGGVIPPNSTLNFEIELISVRK